MLFMSNPYAPGRRVRIIKSRSGSHGAIGKEGTIVNKPSNRGLLSSYKKEFSDAIRVQIAPGEVWLIGRPDEVELEYL